MKNKKKKIWVVKTLPYDENSLCFSEKQKDKYYVTSQKDAIILESPEIIERIAYELCCKKYGKNQADALQFSNSLGYEECLMTAEIAVKTILRSLK